MRPPQVDLVSVAAPWPGDGQATVGQIWFLIDDSLNIKMPLNKHLKNFFFLKKECLVFYRVLSKHIVRIFKSLNLKNTIE